jgi:hypothetical protein
LYKHQYAETTGEKLVSFLRRIMDGEEQGPDEKEGAYMKVQQDAKKISGSKYSGFFSSYETTCLYLRFMHLPEEYRAMDAVSLKWALDHFRSDYGGVSNSIASQST